jgi:tripartite-type tricarboxylate transporter receptor subunit TctC
MTWSRALLALAAALASTTAAWGQAYPSRPISVIVPFVAGGPTDSLARILSEPMRKTLGQPLLVENVSGAGGSIGLVRTARAAADGHTIIVGNWTSHVGGPAIYPMPYDVLKDFEPVARLPVSRLWLIGRLGLPPRDGTELIAWLKANPDKPSLGTIGVGSAAHMCGLYFQTHTGTRFQLVPYRGAAPAYQDVIGGNLDLLCADAPGSLGYLRAGKIKAFAVVGSTRWAPAAEVPTTDEVGVPGLDIAFWNGMWAPRGTPREAIVKLNSAVADAFADPTVRQRLVDLGQEIPSREQQTPQALAAYHKAEIDKWWPLIKSAGIKPD